MATKRPVTNHLTRWLITHSGWREAQHSLQFIAQWGIARRHYDGMTVEDYADYWELSRSQAFRQQARYRDSLHGWYPDVNDVCDALEVEWPKVFADGDPDKAILGLLQATV